MESKTVSSIRLVYHCPFKLFVINVCTSFKSDKLSFSGQKERLVCLFNTNAVFDGNSDSLGISAR